jgi:acyl-CoA reductase-like NAD-dependent aldehyde dehydrogenase
MGAALERQDDQRAQQRHGGGLPQGRRGAGSRREQGRRRRPQRLDKGNWSRLSHKERAVYLRKIAAELNKRSADNANVWTSESGVVAAASVPGSAGLGGIFEYYAGLADAFTFEEERKPTAGGNYGLIHREPVGVVAAIIPWNAPAMLAAYKCAPALLAGCTAVLKASPEAPGAVYILAEAAEKAGLPPGVLNILTADREVSELLVRHPGIDKVTFTGSTAAGMKIASICGSPAAPSSWAASRPASSSTTTTSPPPPRPSPRWPPSSPARSAPRSPASS